MLKTVTNIVNASQIIGVLPVVNGGTGVTTSTGTGSTVLSAAPTLSGNVGLSTGNIVPATAGKGVNFTANTPAAGMTSQLLNWYEEGTWTPTIDSVTQGTGRSTTVTSAKYTRTGRVVFVETSISLTTLGSGGSGSLAIFGLPFTSSATSSGTGSCTNVTGLLANSVGLPTVGVKPSVSHVILYTTTAIGLNPGQEASFATYAKAGMFLTFSCTYTI